MANNNEPQYPLPSTLLEEDKVYFSFLAKGLNDRQIKCIIKSLHNGKGVKRGRKFIYGTFMMRNKLIVVNTSFTCHGKTKQLHRNAAPLPLLPPVWKENHIEEKQIGNVLRFQTGRFFYAKIRIHTTGLSSISIQNILQTLDLVSNAMEYTNKKGSHYIVTAIRLKRIYITEALDAIDGVPTITITSDDEENPEERNDQDENRIERQYDIGETQIEIKDEHNGDNYQTTTPSIQNDNQTDTQEDTTITASQITLTPNTISSQAVWNDFEPTEGNPSTEAQPSGNGDDNTSTNTSPDGRDQEGDTEAQLDANSSTINADTLLDDDYEWNDFFSQTSERRRSDATGSNNQSNNSTQTNSDTQTPNVNSKEKAEEEYWAACRAFSKARYEETLAMQEMRKKQRAQEKNDREEEPGNEYANREIECRKQERLRLKLSYNPRAIQNLTDTEIPDQIQHILAMGPKFALPVKYSTEEIEEFKAAVKDVLEAHCLPNDRVTINNALADLIKNNMQKEKLSRPPREKYLLNALSDFRAFFKQHPELMVVESDKGKSAVVMKKQEYIDKVEALLADTATYSPATTNQINGYIKVNSNLLIEAANRKLTSLGEAKAAISSENKLPNLYGRIKTHKEGQPIRPIVNTRNSPGYHLNQIMIEKWTPLIDRGKYNVTNSAQVMDCLNHITLMPEDKFFSIDAVSMFTNISPRDAKNSILKKVTNHHQKKIHNIERRLASTQDQKDRKMLAKLKAEEDWNNTEFLLKAYTPVNEHFMQIQFGDKIYNQKTGFRMGSSISSLGTDIFMEEILDTVLQGIPQPKLLLKYVDDMLLVCSEDLAKLILTRLNARHPRLKFTMEKEENDTLNYLDIQIIRTSAVTFETKWYTKPTSSDRILHWTSNHSDLVIQNTGIAFVKQMKTVTSSKHHPEMKTRAKQLLLTNGYPKTAANVIIKGVFGEEIPKLKDVPRPKQALTLLAKNKHDAIRKKLAQKMLKAKIRSEAAKKQAKIQKRKYSTAVPQIPKITTTLQKMVKNTNPELTIPTTQIHTSRREIFLPQRSNKRFQEETESETPTKQQFRQNKNKK